jgi:hypothetical protein
MYEATASLIRARGRRLLELMPWLDVDLPDDLRALRRQFERGGPGLRRQCPRTAGFLDGLDDRGLRGSGRGDAR